MFLLIPSTEGNKIHIHMWYHLLWYVRMIGRPWHGKENDNVMRLRLKFSGFNKLSSYSIPSPLLVSLSSSFCRFAEKISELIYVLQGGEESYCRVRLEKSQ